jgi:acetyl esterase/lipase
MAPGRADPDDDSARRERTESDATIAGHPRGTLMKHRLIFLLLAGLPAAGRADGRFEIEVVKDVAYGKEERQKLDLYLPAAARDFPLMLFVHGGGYQKGDRKEVHLLGETFARRGVAVAAMSYRLYPPAKHPAQIQDVAGAFSFLKANAKKYRADESKIAVGGHSAGAHLASLLATDASYLQAEKRTLADVAVVVSISGGYRILHIRKDVFGSGEAMEQASPLAHVRGNHPPFLIIYGDGDSPERHAISKEFNDLLKKAGTKTELREIKNRNHAELFSKIADEDPTTECVIEFLHKTLKK